ncbi:hypothetical protein CBS101457_005789 [Exobasidium rhododendri]|nr:hypothetical protein CBS101457_005789 [Exobasidium rhododendri]
MSDEAARRALLLDSGTSEAVTVNQRALIDKILARYAAEHTVFRELIQNADDAGAHTCELRLHSVEGSKNSQDTDLQVPNLKGTLKSWVFRNNGKPFNGDDWNRLRRIAEGNPDPDRIGAFGVGFYSLFSIAEEPMVSSGSQLMGFFWKDDSLFTRKATSPTNDLSPSGVPWTTFHMALREPAPFPDSLLELSRFLATSLTFTANVKHLSLFFDDQPLCRLTKRLESPKNMVMPSHLNATTPKKMMRVQNLESTAMRLDVEAMKLVLDQAETPKPLVASLASAFSKQQGGLAGMLQNAFGRSKEKEKIATLPPSAAIESSSTDMLVKTANALTTISSSVHVRIATATANVSVDRAFEKEIERSTKKPPPKVTKLQVIAQNKEEYDASNSSSQENVAQIFKGIMPVLDRQGHIFIGFKTSQTTSFAGHLAARFIPTVERESIDFIDRYCAQWNNELLALGGYVTRAVYEAELAEVGKIWNEKVGPSRPKEDDKIAQGLLDRALHLLRFFTFRSSTPSPRVHVALETSFFASARQNTLTLASTRGVKHSALVRFPNAILSEFVKDLAVVPSSHVEQASEFMALVKSHGLVGEITMEDVFSELSGRALSILEAVACLKWWISVSNHPNYEPSLRRRLLDNALLDLPGKEGSPSTIQQLATVQTFLNPQRVPTDVPHPTTCLSFEVSKAFTAADLNRVFGWNELTVAAWLRHVVSLCQKKETPTEVNLQTSPPFAEKVIGIIARAWGSLPAQQHEEVSSVLKEIACIPTRKGMQKPTDSYFSNVSLFEDLPILALPNLPIKGNVEKVMIALGVRRHVELQMIFDRLVAAGDWDVTQLITYLAANKETLSALEKDRLVKTAMFPKAGEVGPPGKDGKPRILRYRASQLYEPVDSLKSLGLPLLDWPGKVWRAGSDEAKFAYELGLKRHPPLEELLRLASTETSDTSTREKAFAYLLDKHASVYKTQYSLKVASPFAFVPSQVGSTKTLKKPGEVFTNPEASILEFPIVSQSISMNDVSKLALRVNPTSTQIIAKLVNEATRDISLARRRFEYLSSVSEFTPSDYSLLKSARFIPYKKGDQVSLSCPSESYFGDKSTNSALKDVLNEIFIFIDFGERATIFLRNCGVSKEPSIEEVTTQLIKNPAKFYSIAGVDNYLGILRQIATNWQKMSSPLRSEMKRSNFMLASKRISAAATSSSKAGSTKKLIEVTVEEEDDEDGDDEQGMLVHDLRKPGEVVIVDDATSHMLFASVLFVAPHEDLIEGLAESLGAPRLSRLVEEKYAAAGQIINDSALCSEIKAIVLERTPLFLFEKKQTSKSEIQHDGDWLKSNLQVVEVDGRGLRLTRQLRFGSLNETNEQKCSAMATLTKGKLTLYIASNAETDWFEVALALSKHLLIRQRLQEVLLYMTLLSTSLRSLKRRGFHVDKILSQRKADRDLVERRMREERSRLELEEAQRPKESQIQQWTKDILAVFPDADPRYVGNLLRDSKEGDHIVNATNAMLEKPYPRVPPSRTNGFGDEKKSLREKGGEEDKKSSSNQKQLTPAANTNESTGAGGAGFFNTWRNKIKGGLDAGDENRLPGGWQRPTIPPAASAAAAAAARAMTSNQGQIAESIAGSTPSGSMSESTARNPNAGVTPSSNIKRKVLSAIEASQGRPESNAIQSQTQQTKVKEAESTYCDTTGVAMSLRLAGKVSDMNIFVSPELDPSSTISNNFTSMQRFVDDIIRPIIEVFNLDPKSVNVFVDVSGPSIAFNRGGTLFLNFRYHLIWFDEEIKQGQLVNALISTYHSLAHELAHNLVAAHDSEHEFWFSSICEQFFLPFSRLVLQAQAHAQSAA